MSAACRLGCPLCGAGSGPLGGSPVVLLLPASGAAATASCTCVSTGAHGFVGVVLFGSVGVAASTASFIIRPSTPLVRASTATSSSTSTRPRDMVSRSRSAIPFPQVSSRLSFAAVRTRSVLSTCLSFNSIGIGLVRLLTPFQVLWKGLKG